MDYILQDFCITNKEYEQLDKLFGDLAQYEAWQLIKKNARNNHIYEQEDIVQELRWSIVKAGSYYKRQVYLEDCFRVAKIYAKKDNLVKKIVDELEDLWTNRTRHGASRQKFGVLQERILEQIIASYVRSIYRPKKNRPLRIDSKFKTYCKAISWNCQKSLGKKITREKPIRTGLVSLSEYDYLGKYY